MNRIRATLAVLSVLALTGCAVTPAALPDEVTVSVYQNRFDYGLRQLELKVSNATSEAITVTRATFESTRFETPAVWDRPQVVPSGGARDLKVQLGAPACGDGDPSDVVTLEFTLPDGTIGSGTVVPSDETGRLEVINAEDCVGAAVATHATISGPAEALWTPGAHEPAVIDLSVVPTAAEGSASIVFVKGTVLLSLVDDSGAELYQQDLNLVVDSQSLDSVIRLLVVPSRCDPHAVAEDKRGTFFPLEVTTSEGASGRIFVPMSDEVRASLYEFFGDYCGF